MRWIDWTGAAMVVVLACGTSAAAQSGWHAYHNVKYGFSVETPADPRISEDVTQASSGPVPTLSGAIDLHDRGGLIFTVTDYSATTESTDPDVVLDGLVKALVQRDNSVLDSEISITVQGAPGREIVAHTSALQRRMRFVYLNQQLYGLIAVGPVSSGAPREYERFAGSLSIDR
jgi:hypothetical protein